jgi:hypothetical protein
MSLGEALCFSLDFDHKFCHDIKENQALCMLGGESARTCTYVNFEEARCIALGLNLKTCTNISPKTLKPLKDEKKIRAELEIHEKHKRKKPKLNSMRKLKLILKQFFKDNIIKRAELVERVDVYGKKVLYPKKEIANRICLRMEKDSSLCENNLKLGEALCMSLKNTLSWCKGVTTVQALCLKSGLSKAYCKTVTFSEAFCLEAGFSRSYCQKSKKEDILKFIKKKRKKENKDLSSQNMAH